MQKNFRNNSPYFIFQIIARLHTAEEPPEILVNDYDDGEMESGNSLDETSSSDVEETSV